jgi:hypothetical protein
MHSCGNATSCRASPQASSRACAGSTSRLTRPIPRASSPETPRPVRIKSSAWLIPISRGNRTVPPSISGTPKRRQNTPKTASRAATRMSHHTASSRPPATANPSTAAITGLPRTMRVHPSGPSPSGSTRFPFPPAAALRSAPAQKQPPAPVRIATRRES